MKKLSGRILDCTLRDGGYYNNWQFNRSFVEKYLLGLSETPVSRIEIGFRSPIAKDFKGPYFYSSEVFLETLKTDSKAEFGVMINASDFSETGFKKEIECLFVNQSTSLIRFVRIASHLHEVDKSLNIASVLQKKGYSVCLNLMQISEVSMGDLARCASDPRLQEEISCFYIADSLGCLYPKNIDDIHDCIRASFQGSLGIHTHDNCGFALTNSLRACELGFDWIDSTLLGMGRGPGNVSTESLLGELFGYENFLSSWRALGCFVVDEMASLKTEFGWGSDLLYAIAGSQRIHPTFVQKMCSDNNSSAKSKLLGLSKLSKCDGAKYSESVFVQLASSVTFSGAERGKSFGSNLEVNKRVAVIANNECSEVLSDDIAIWAKREKVSLVGLNAVSFFSDSLDLTFCCHPTRIDEVLDLDDRGSRLVAPFSLATDDLIGTKDPGEMLDIPYEVVPGQLSLSGGVARIPCLDVLAYTLAVICSGEKVEEIFFVGITGEGIDTSQFNRTSEILRLTERIYPSIKLKSLVPTSYALPIEGLYGLF